MTYKGLLHTLLWSIILYSCSIANGYGQNYTFPFEIGKCSPLLTHDTISITFVGDVMMHGRQIREALIDKSDNKNPESYNFGNFFRFIKDDIKKSDIAVANMEFTVGTTPYSGYPLFSAPESIIWEAQQSGFNLFLLANNHILDKGKSGFEKTLELYSKNNAQYTGAYLSVEEQEREYPKMIRIRDLKIAFLNFTYSTNGFPVPKGYCVNRIDTTHIKEAINKAKEQGADIIIAAPHWGDEYQSKANQKQRELANFMISNGVHVIIGSHPHVTQDGYIDKNNVVFYSLGNYISNQSVPANTQLGLMVTIKIVKNLITKDCYISDAKYNYLWCFRGGEFLKDYTVVKIDDILNKRIETLDSIKTIKAIKTYKKVIASEPIKNYKHKIEQ